MDRAPAAVSLSSLRWVFFSGEPLTGVLVRRWRSLLPGTAGIVNLYGPTETTMAKCFYVVPPTTETGVQPVGNALPDTQALVLSENNHQCGVNEPGEVVIRTPFGTRGYVNAPEENQNRFIPNPFRDDVADVLYRTGDRGVYRQDGALMVLGRLDDQVKIHGVRIEPAEVSAVLDQHPDARTCTVVGRQDAGGPVSLVAYVVARQPGMTGAVLRAYLAERLPAAMVPAAFVFLERMPLTPNGKINRAALPPPLTVTAAAHPGFIAPRTQLEQFLAALWLTTLQTATVGVHDDFFELGGHSLLATEVTARIRKDLEIELPVRVLFEAPTVAQLAERIERIRDSNLSEAG
jgi:acyl-coenzyme A synthetase/AMP-(fatty) acid ligase